MAEEKLFEIQTDKIENGSKLMYKNTALTSWTGDLSSLQNGSMMFSGCTNLTSFTGDLSSLTNGSGMFGGTQLTSFDSDLSSLTDGSMMFFGCTNLTSFDSDLSYLTDGYLMFSGCKLDAESLKRIAISLSKTNIPNTTIAINIGTDYLADNGDGSATPTDAGINRDFNLITHKGWTLSFFGDLHYRWEDTDLKYAGCTTDMTVKAKDGNYLTNDIVNGVWGEHLPDLTTGDSLFRYCTTLTSFNSDLSSLTDGTYMFDNCTNLTNFTSNLSSLNDGYYMFYNCTALTTFTTNLSSLTSAKSMFQYCSNLTTFTSDLSSLTDGTYMFQDCTNLTSFTSNLSSLTNGYYMFIDCFSLTTFTSDLSSLTNGFMMFQNCTNLATFASDLSSLTNGSMMFNNCKLNTDSLIHIAETINDVRDLTNGSSPFAEIYKTVYIGIGNTTPNTNETTALNTMANKGWTVYVNGSKYTPTSTASIMTLDELGNEVETPIPFYAKPMPSDEEHGDYVDAEGNYYNILGGQFIYGDDLSTYGMFTCEADAAANMRLTKIEK